MEIKPVARFHCPVGGKFGLPRQSGIVDSLKGHIVFEPKYRNPDAIRGLEGFSHIWLIWGFSCNGASEALTVRPPRLGGNERVGVFASRSPFRPNAIGLSSVKLMGIEHTKEYGAVIHVAGADLMDGTPIYDIKPYLTLADCHPEAVCGFAAKTADYSLRVEFPDKLQGILEEKQQKALIGVLAQDPRPSYQQDPERIYIMSFSGYEVSFRVDKDILTVCDMIKG